MELVLLFLLKIQFYQYVALKDDLLRKKNVELVSWCIKHSFESDALTWNIVYVQPISQSELLYIT